jgi:hypothetical protein
MTETSVCYKLRVQTQIMQNELFILWNSITLMSLETNELSGDSSAVYKFKIVITHNDKYTNRENTNLLQYLS